MTKPNANTPAISEEMFAIIASTLEYSTRVQSVDDSNMWRNETTIEARPDILDMFADDEAAWALMLANSLPGRPGVIGNAVSYMWDGGVEEFDDVWADSETEYEDLETVVSILNSPKFVGFTHHDYFSRCVILDSIDIAPAFRGRGFGLKAAALCLFISGGNNSDTLIAAVAGGSKLDGRDKTTKNKVRNLLMSLGLPEHSASKVPLFAAHSSHARFSATLTGIAEQTCRK